MKELNINLDLKGIELENDSKVKTGPELFINWIENAIISSYNSEDGRPGTMPEEHRRLAYKLLDTLEGHKNGIVNLSDKTYGFLQERWKAKKFGAITINKQFRSVFKQIDQIVTPDEKDSD